MAIWGLIVVGYYFYKRWIGRPFDIAPLIGPMGITIGSAWQFRKRTAEAHSVLPSVDATLKAVPVALEIRSDKAPRVREIGWISLHDGWLAYEGVRSSFYLSQASVVQLRIQKEESFLWIDDGRELQFSVLTDASESDFVEAPLDPGLPQTLREPSPLVRRFVSYFVSQDSTEWPRSVDLPALFKEWLAQPAVEGSPTYPPVAPHPEFVAKGLGRWFAVFVVGALLAPFAAALQAWAWAWLFGGVALGTFAWFAIGLRKFQRELPEMIG